MFLVESVRGRRSIVGGDFVGDANTLNHNGGQGEVLNFAIHVCPLAEDGTAESWIYDTDDRAVWSVLDIGLRCVNRNVIAQCGQAGVSFVAIRTKLANESALILRMICPRWI